jgi:hypothetical protein
LAGGELVVEALFVNVLLGDLWSRGDERHAKR